MDQVTQIRERTDIVSLLSEHIPLKKTGHNFKGLCPFHGEKSPSFVVSPDRQIWHCFGCGKGGDCYTFLMEYENLEFPEALRILAKRAGITLEQLSEAQIGISSKKEVIYTLNKLAAEFYHYVLTTHPAGKNALAYLLETRKINPQVINTFHIGFAPSGGMALSKYLMTKKKYKADDLVDAGLGTKRGSLVFDFFQGRLIFPLFDHRDNIVGFSGRGLVDTAIPKYINTRETLVYQKSHHFFGINIAKQTIKKENKAIIMEGEFDVISAFQEGITNCVAIKGTALTDDHVRLISRFCQRVSLCFDQDNAGQEALKRSVTALEKKGLSMTVVPIVSGKDADELIKTDPYAFKHAVKHDVGIYDYLLTTTLEKNDTKTAEGKRKASSLLLPFFAGIENEIVKEHYLRRLSTELDTSFETITKQVEKLGKEKTTHIASLIQKKEKRERREILEEYIIALVSQYQMPKKLLQEIDILMQPYIFKEEAYGKIWSHMMLLLKNTLHETGETVDGKRLATSLPSELLPAYNICFLLPLPQFEEGKDEKTELKKAAKDVIQIFTKLEIKTITQQIKDLEKNESGETIEALQEQLTQKITALQSMSAKD